MTSKPGYLLPAGEAYTDELACTLVFYPDKEEYRRALLGSIVYLSNWLAWERDSEKRGKDAARAWKNAVDETLECWTMACFEELIADVARIRELMETKKDCCDDNVTYFPTEEPTTEITPHNGPAPDYYGETAISDWDDWHEHVCYNAHKYVDHLISSASELYTAVEISSIFLGLIAAALSLLAFTGIGLPIAYGLAAAVVAGIALGATATTFLNTGTDLETARQSIVCAIVAGYSLSDAVESALSSGTDWDLFYQWIDYDTAIAVLYEGGYGSEYLPTETRTDCDCASAEEFKFTFPTDIDSWEDISIITSWDAGEFLKCTPNATAQWKLDGYWPWQLLDDRFGFTLPITFNQMKYKFMNSGGTGVARRYLWRWTVRYKDDEVFVSEVFDTDDFPDDEWIEMVWNFPQTVESGLVNDCFNLRLYAYQQTPDDQRLCFDDIGIFSA